MNHYRQFVAALQAVSPQLSDAEKSQSELFMSLKVELVSV